jgi:capsular exopolysaccharide synthesis family protein
MVSAGKTFCATNLASIFALYGKKTLLLGFDLRKPKVYLDYGATGKEGITSYLINKSDLDSIIQNSGLDNYDVIVAGTVPPNPAELIASDKCMEFFTKLKERYDYIIIDTPPIGLVTDAFLLMKYSDVNLFLVRQGFTHKKIFASIIKDIELRQIPNVAILINDVKLHKGSYGYGYGYGYAYGSGYGYGYGYGYYSDDKKMEKKSLLRRLFSRA